MPANDVDTSAVDRGGRDDETAGIAALSLETRGNYHLSPTPAEHSGNEGGLTELEDMRLNRLLRSTSCSASTTPLPSGALPTSSSTGHRGSLGRNDSPGPSETTDQVELATTDFGSRRKTFAGGACGVSRELFGDSPTPEGGGSGGSWRILEKGASFEAMRGVVSSREEQEDDLEDISDGGFHSGCWRRKYVRGEMR